MIDKSDNETDSPELASEPDYTRPARPPKARGAGFALFIAFLALFFTAAGIAAGYKHWQRMSDRAKGNARDIAALEEVIASKSDNQAVRDMLAEMNRNHAEQQQKITEQMSRMNQLYHQTEQFSNTVTSQVKEITALQANLQQATAPDSTRDNWLSEVSFLLKLAIRQLHLSGNRESAMSALREADQLLSENGSVSYLPVRQQIAADLATLEAAPAVDMVALSQQITTLSQQLEPVPDTELLTEATIPAPAVTDTPETASSQREPATSDNAGHPLWQDYKDKAAEVFSQAIIIRQLDQSLAEELDFTTREQAYQLLQLRLEVLRLMALQHQDQAYQQQLSLLKETIKRYYAAPQADTALQTLDQLGTVQLNPPLPDISGSLRQLEKARTAGGTS